MDLDPQKDRSSASANGRLNFCLNFFRLGALLNPFIYFCALMRANPKSDWLGVVALAALVLQLVFPFGLLLIIMGPRAKSSDVIYDFFIVLVGWAIVAVMVYFLIVYTAAHAGC
ncbi:hypothetical protein [Luteolibacter soli]|uniref:Uncharacterized protein n=1 Tax=Luteolibacter soli TaxID=3135280 RepID=A0ABU9B0S9_9BACT